MMKKYAVIVFLFVISNLNLIAQAAESSDEKTPLPTTFREFSLGMNLEDLKTSLTKDSYFAFRGDRDVSYLPVSDQNLVESAGTSFIKRAFFQLKDSAIFIMAFTMNTGMIDHYSVFTAFVEKYGQPQVLSPKEAVWEQDNVRISIERPLTVKYIDKQVFDALVDDSRVVRSRSAELREEFLDDF
ncbi:MAG: hypothetical protein LBD07_04545 [Spirochaetaceae bacterium]|jgi:hypothetical protein|nr:hypothetical protein [Spirochaetaceae bacterium]